MTEVMKKKRSLNITQTKRIHQTVKWEKPRPRPTHRKQTSKLHPRRFLKSFPMGRETAFEGFIQTSEDLSSSSQDVK